VTRLALAALLLAAPALAGLSPDPDVSADAPQGWRQSIEGPFTFFLPPKLLRVGPKLFDSIAGKFAGTGLRVEYDYGYYVPDCVDGDQASIGGRRVEIVRTAAANGGLRVTACFAAPKRGAKRLTIRAEANNEATAEDALTAFQTIRFAKQP
jgi:hypothetical protein